MWHSLTGRRSAQSDSKLETVRGLDITRTDPTVVAARNQRADAEQRAGDIARGIRKEEAAEEQAAQKENAAERSANCDAAQARLKRYSESRRLYRQTPDGEREYLRLLRDRRRQGRCDSVGRQMVWLAHVR